MANFSTEFKILDGPDGQFKIKFVGSPPSGFRWRYEDASFKTAFTGSESPDGGCFCSDLSYPNGNMFSADDATDLRVKRNIALFFECDFEKIEFSFDALN